MRDRDLIDSLLDGMETAAKVLRSPSPVFRDEAAAILEGEVERVRRVLKEREMPESTQ